MPADPLAHVLSRWGPALRAMAEGPAEYGPHNVEALATATERLVRERDEARRERDEALAGLADRQRLLDLVRHQRGVLHEAALISDEEYATLAGDHGAVARLEGYDAARAQLAGLRAYLTRSIANDLGGMGEACEILNNLSAQDRATVDAWTREMSEPAYWSKEVADLQGQLRDADATAAGLRVEASEAAMAAAVGEAVVAALHGEDVSDFMQSFGPVMEAQTMAHTIALLHGDVEAQRRVIVDACAVLRVTDDAEEDWPKLPAAVADLAARLAEVEATLANERGEGEPVEGWTWALEGDIASTCWHHPSGAVVYLEPMDGPIPPGHAWMWWVPGMPGCQSATTARAAMRAASERLRGTP